ncbi:DUF2721 domain-containing protein [Massilia sp. 9096]|uniref:DUF2721 domain-containing protein n=1 Tax=Massilia sp. 9096 TaxID=1500894 RepID=UPI00056A06CD|nr:DUF2721 domain-containing protein [Massilia sp. 9096]
MDFALKDVMQAVGPNASLVFASWIFMSFLQTRYSNAYQLYRKMIDDLREGKVDGQRRTTIHDEIVLYRERLNRMRLATNLGLYAAILLLSTLILSGLDVVFGNPGFLKYICAVCVVLGLGLIIWSASLVIIENKMLKMALDRDGDDLAELRDAAKAAQSRQKQVA